MKTMMSLTEMAVELDRQQKAKRDFLAPTGRLHLTGPDTVTLLAKGELIEEFSVTPHAHGQIAADLKIPKAFYDRLKAEQPDMLAWNVNEFWKREPKRRMLRTMDGRARAFVSDKFSVDYDNFALATYILPELQAFKGLTFDSIGLTETHFYLKAFWPRIETTVKKGDVVQAGFVLRNSEVGDGSIEVLPMAKVLACLNGMILARYGQRRAHVGKRLTVQDESYELYSDETRTADARAFFLKMRDTIRAVLTQQSFEKIVASFNEAYDAKLEGSVEGAVEVVKNNFDLTQSSADGVLRHLIEGRDLSIYGLANAVTRQSQDEDDYETATKLERDGGRIIELPADAWREIVRADKPLKKAA